MATAAKIGIGSAINRVDGVEKVTGTARYAAEHPVENLLYGYIVDAAIAKGRIVRSMRKPRALCPASSRLSPTSTGRTSPGPTTATRTR